MATTQATRGVERAFATVTSRSAAVAGGVGLALILTILAYVAVTGTEVVSVRHLLLPVVWIVAGTWLVAHLGRSGDGLSPLAVGVAVVYFLLLGAIGSTLGLPAGATGVRVVPATPGWGPMLVYGGPVLSVVVVPYEVVGYLALAYGVGRAVEATSRGAFAGLLGLFACVGCVLPLFAAIGALFGGTATAALHTSGLTTDLATLVYLSTVAALALAVQD